jgi:hypothetical protein
LSVSNAAPSNLSATEAPTPTPISRANIILAVLLLAQLALVAYVFWPSRTTTSSGEPLLEDLTADAVTALTITDDSDRSVSFTRDDSGWTLANTDGYPANADKITETLTKLLSISTDRLVTRTPSSHSRLQVGDNDYLRKVVLTTANGEQTLYLGSSTGASATHVRAAGQDATYLTDAVATWELDTLTTPWIDVAYFKVPKEQIETVTLENANGIFTFVRKGEDNGEEWTLADAAADEQVSTANISTLIDRVATLNLHTVLGKSESPDYGLSTPLATITVTTLITATETTTDTVASPEGNASVAGKEETTTLLVGAKDEETDTYYLKSSGSEYYVRLAAFTGDEFVNKQRTDFLAQPEDAAAGNMPPSASLPITPSVESEAEPTPAASEAVTDTGTITNSETVTD